MNNICILLLISLLIVWLIYRSNKNSMRDKPKHFLSLHTVFILNENIKWLDEFLTYYNHIGFDHFYLYDNEGSIGRSGSSSNRNKYGYKIDTTNSERDKQLLNDILDKHNNVTYIKWQPRDKNGNIVYGHKASVEHMKENYGDEIEWVAIMDLDEFIFSEKDIDIREFLANQPDDVNAIQLRQKKFKSRHLSDKELITQEYECWNYIPKSGYKNIIKLKHRGITENMHDVVLLEGKMKEIDPNSGILRFNHYQADAKALQLIKTFENPEDNSLPTLDGYDNSMKRYKHIYNE